MVAPAIPARPPDNAGPCPCGAPLRAWLAGRVYEWPLPPDGIGVWLVQHGDTEAPRRFPRTAGQRTDVWGWVAAIHRYTGAGA